jgi:hypothetical protein
MRPPWDSVNDFLQIYPGTLNQGLDPANLRDQFFPASAFVLNESFTLPGGTGKTTGAWSSDSGDQTMPAAQMEPRVYCTKGKATLNFNGTSLVLRIQLDSDWGTAAIYIDGKAPSTMGLATALDTINCNLDTSSYPGMQPGVRQYIDVLVADGLTPGLHTVDLYATNGGTTKYLVVSGAKVRSYNKQPFVLSGWKAANLNTGKLTLANRGADAVLNVTLQVPATFKQASDGTAFASPIAVGNLTPDSQFDLNYSIDGSGQPDNVSIPLYLSGLYRDPAGAVQVNTPFTYGMTSSAVTFGPLNGWSFDADTPDGSTRAISNGTAKTLSFFTSATSVDFTLQRDNGWGTASVLVNGVSYGTLTSNDAVGGGFLAVQTISGLPAGKKQVVISTLGTAAHPLVITKIAGQNSDWYSQVNETIFVNYAFSNVPPFAVDAAWAKDDVGVTWVNPDTSKVDLSIPRDSRNATGVRAYARFPTFAVYYQSGKQDILSSYDLVIVDPNGVSRQDVQALQAKGIKVLGYVSFGEEDGIVQDIYDPNSPIGPWRDDGLGTGGYASYYNKGGNLYGEPTECNRDLQRTQGLKQCELGRAEYFTGRGRCSQACTFDSRAGYVTYSAGGKCGGGFTSSNNWIRDESAACTNGDCPKYTPVNKKCPKWIEPDVGWGQDFSQTEDFPDQNGIWGSTYINPLAPRWKEKLQTLYLPTVLDAGVKYIEEVKTLVAYGSTQMSFRAAHWPIDDAEELVLTNADRSITYTPNLHFGYDKATGAFTMDNNVGVEDFGWPPLVAGQQLLLTYTRKGLQCDGVFMDTVDTVDIYPSDAFQQAMADMINSLFDERKATTPKLFCSNRGFTILPKIVQSCEYVMFESWLTDYDFEKGVYGPITDPESIAFNNGVKAMLRQLRREHTFDVLSLNYCTNGPAGNTLRQYLYDTDSAEGYMSWSSVIELDDPLPQQQMQTTVAAAIRSNVWALLRSGGLTDGQPNS